MLPLVHGGCSLGARIYSRCVVDAPRTVCGRHGAEALTSAFSSGGVSWGASRSGQRTVFCSAGRDEGSFFFKPARVCGGGDGQQDEAFLQDSELRRRVARLEPMRIDVVNECVSEEAADAIACTVARMGGGILRTGFEVTIESEYTAVFSLLLSALCTGYGLRSAESRMHIQQGFQDAIGMEHPQGGIQPLDPEVKSTLPVEVAEHIDALERSFKEKNEPRKAAGGNRLLKYLAHMRPENSLELAIASSREVMQAFQCVVQQQMETFRKYETGAPQIWSRMRQQMVEVSLEELSRALEWCMLVGYYTHCEEYRISLEHCMDTPHDIYGKDIEEVDSNEEAVEQSSGLLQGIKRILGGF